MAFWPRRDASEVVLVDERDDFESVDLVDLSESLTGCLGFAKVRLERGELAGERRLDHEVLEILAREGQVAVETFDRDVELADLLLLEVCVDLGCVCERCAHALEPVELQLRVLDVGALDGARAFERLNTAQLLRGLLDLELNVDQLARMRELRIFEGELACSSGD